MVPHGRAHASANAITIHGSAQNLAYGEAYTGASGVLALTIKSRHIPGKVFPALLVDHLKVSMLQQSRVPGEALRHFFRSFIHGWSGRQNGHCRRNYSRKPGFTETRLRPLARRRDSTALPLFVFIRVRKPCTLERRRR